MIKIGTHKHPPLSLTVDATESAKQKQALDSVVKKFGKIDILVLNAGRSQRSLAVNTPIEDTKSIFDLNIISAIDLTRNTLPHMLENGNGHIVAISSVTGKNGILACSTFQFPHMIQYCNSGKFGVPISSSYSASKFAMQVQQRFFVSSAFSRKTSLVLHVFNLFSGLFR